MDTLQILIRALNTQESTPRASGKVHWYDRPVSPDHVLVLGVGFMLGGFISKQFWFTLGGFMFFLMGIMAIMSKEGMSPYDGCEKGEGADTGSEGDSDEPVGRTPNYR